MTSLVVKDIGEVSLMRVLFLFVDQQKWRKAIDRAFSLVRKPNTANSCGYFVSPIFYFFFNSASCYCGSCLESGFLDTKQPPRWTNTVEGNSLTSRSPPKKNHRACDDCREVGRQDLIDAQGADTWLVGGWTNPSEKYARQIGNLPQKRGKNKIIWNHHLANHWFPLKKGPNPNLWGWYLREGWLKRMLWHLKLFEPGRHPGQYVIPPEVGWHEKAGFRGSKYLYPRVWKSEIWAP